MDHSTSGFPVHHQLPEVLQTHVYWVGDLILCCLLLLPPSIFPSIRVFSKESDGQSIGVLASVSVLPRNNQVWFPSGWTGWNSLQSKGFTRVFSNTTVQHSSTASILQHSAFFIVQLLHPYMTTGKTIALTKWTFVGKVVSVFEYLSRLVVTFLLRSKHLLISWLIA